MTAKTQRFLRGFRERKGEAVLSKATNNLIADMDSANASNVERYVRATARQPRAWSGRADLSDVTCAAFTIGEAARYLSSMGVDVTTIHEVPFADAPHDTQNDVLELGEGECATVRAEAREHYN